MSNMAARLLMALTFVLSTVVTLADQPEPMAAVHVAVLMPQVVGDLPEPQRDAFAGALDAVMTDQLGSDHRYRVVDRQALDAMLAERELTNAKVDALNVQTIAAPLRPLFSAGVLLVSEVDLQARSVIVEAVSAQRGTRLGGLYLQLDQLAEDDLAQAVGVRLPQLLDRVQASLAADQDKQLVEVISDLPGGLERSRWLSDEAADVARQCVASAGEVSLLVPRRPMVTREERLLRLMGLSQARPGDAAAGLRVSPEIVVRTRVTEQTEVGATFSKTPITLSATVTTADAQTISKTWTGPAQQWDRLLASMKQWLDRELARLGQGDPTQRIDDEKRARELAQRELASIDSWTGLGGSQIGSLPMRTQMRLSDAARRAAHLDPTNETAAWMVAMTYLANQQAQSAQNWSEQFCRQVMLELQRYLDRFGADHAAHHRDVLHRMIRIGMGRMWVLQKKGTPEVAATRGGQLLLGEPDPAQYEIARRYVRAMADWGARSLTDPAYRGGNTHAVFGNHVVNMLVPNIPDDQIADEYAWWQRFYTTRIHSVPDHQRYAHHGADVMTPWPLVQAAFAARRGEPDAVRKALQEVADQYPLDVRAVWGGNRHEPLIVRTFLRAAGDTEADKWLPSVSDAPGTVTIAFNDMAQLMQRLRPQTPPVWESGSSIDLPGIELVVPKSVRDSAFLKGAWSSRSAEAVLQTGRHIWLTAPGIFPQNLSVDTHLWVGVMEPDGPDRRRLVTSPIPWPKQGENDSTPHWSWAHAVDRGDRSVVFMGTEARGLLRLEQDQSQWRARWLDATHGLPSNRIDRLATVQHNGQPQLLVICREQIQVERGYRQVAVVYVLDVDTGRATLLYDGRSDAKRIMHPAAALGDGRRVLLELAGSEAYPELLDVQQIAGFVRSGAWTSRELPMPFVSPHDGPGQPGRLWWSYWHHHPPGHRLVELDAHSLEPVGSAAPGRAPEKRVSVAVDTRRVCEIFSHVMAGSAAPSDATIEQWPRVDTGLTVGSGDVLWMAIGHAGRLTRIVGYRPAPRDTQDWAGQDQWFGPFQTPGNQYILGLRRAEQSGQLLLSTTGHVKLLDERRLIEAAQRAQAVRSTSQWRGAYAKRAAKRGLSGVVPVLLLNGQPNEALAMLAAARTNPHQPSRPDQQAAVFDFWQARVLAAMPGRLGEAVDLYDRIASGTNTSPAVEAFARANQIVLLHRQQRWRELLELAQRVETRFPQTQATASSRGIAWYINKAQRQQRGPDQTTAER